MRLKKGKDTYKIKGLFDVTHVVVRVGKIDILLARVPFHGIVVGYCFKTPIEIEEMKGVPTHFAFDRQNEEIVIHPMPAKNWRMCVRGLQLVEV